MKLHNFELKNVKVLSDHWYKLAMDCPTAKSVL